MTPVPADHTTAARHDSPQSWSDISWDPNDRRVIAWQQAICDTAMAPPVAHRVTYLRELAATRRVLDIGVVEHGVSNETSDVWLHRHLSEVASELVGVDVLADEVETLRQRGWDVLVHDLTASPLDAEPFDVVVMGEVIEHLSDPGSLLRNVAAAMRPDGRLVVTTPNPYALHRVVAYLRGRFPDSVDHVTLLAPPNMAELGRRSGLRLDRWRGVRLKSLPGARNTATRALRTAAERAGRNPLLSCDSVIYEFVLAEPPA